MPALSLATDLLFVKGIGPGAGSSECRARAVAGAAPSSAKTTKHKVRPMSDQPCSQVRADTHLLFSPRFDHSVILEAC